MLRVIVVLVIICLVGSPALAQEAINPNPNLSLLWSQVRRQPNDFAVACMPINSPIGTVIYNPDERFPLASVTKLIIFIEYARQVEAGLIPDNEHVNVDALNRYHLDRTDRNSHDRFLSSYPAGTQFISLRDIASKGMIQYSSNAASDFLLERLGPVDWDSLYASLRVTDTDYPHSLSTIALVMDNHETGVARMATIDRLSLETGEEMLHQYVHDPDWRAAEIAYRDRRGRAFPNWRIQAVVLQEHTATGTVSDFLNIMAAIYGPVGPLSADVKQMTHEALRWTENAAINNSYFEYGSKLGFWSGGTMTLVAYGYPRGGQPVISAIFLRNMSRNTFNDLMDEDTIGNLAHWMNFGACSGLLEAIQAR